MINVLDFRDLIIKPTLAELAKVEPRINSDAAVALLLGTALCESELTFLRQRVNGGFGPAISFFQVEPITHEDVKRYLKERRPDLAKRVFAPTNVLDPDDFELATNLRYSTGIARIKYWMDPHPLPLADDIRGLADYYKRVFNTELGKGTAKKFLEFYQRYVRE